MNRQATTHHKAHGNESPAKQKGTQKIIGGKKADGAEGRVPPEIRHAMIAEAAYYRAEKRGFIPGDEMDDWLRAEVDIESMLDQLMH